MIHRSTCFLESRPYRLPEEIVSEFKVETVPLDQCVEDTIRNKIKETHLEDPFFIVDLTTLVEKVTEWRTYLPRVQAFYAMKCNPNPVIVNLLRTLGVKFDCASRGEIEQVLAMPTMSGEDIIYANPCKPKAHITYAKSRGVKTMTFDNADELRKIKEVHPGAELVLRIITDDSQSVCRFSSKYGCPLSNCETLLRQSIELGLKVIGVSFHVGSGCYSADSFLGSIYSAKKVFDLGKALGIEMTLLDIGGGFPGNSEYSHHLGFEEIASVIRPVLDELFPPHQVRIIAEPGRYFATSCCTLATAVIARRKVVPEEGGGDLVESYLYYINDGVYGSFNNLMYDHASARPLDLQARETTHLCTIFGPTCDSLDCLIKDTPMPLLEVGDWLYFKDMGAYTMAAGSNFNGFASPTLFCIQRL